MGREIVEIVNITSMMMLRAVGVYRLRALVFMALTSLSLRRSWMITRLGS